MATFSSFLKGFAFVILIVIYPLLTTSVLLEII